MNKKYPVFISSTFSDLVQERQATIRTVLDLGHIPSGMEIFPAADVEQFEYIKKVIDECDYYILIIGARYGSMDAAGVSFTEKEYDYAVEQKKTVLAFIHGDPGSIAVRKADTDLVLAGRLRTFREKVSKGRLVSFWKTSEELTYRVTIALSKAFGDMPGTGWIRGNAAASEDLLGQLNSLRNRLDVLVAENEDLKERIKPRLDGIAGLNETFRIRYSYKWWEDRRNRYVDGTDDALITWAEIFAACGPKFFRPASPALIAFAVVNYLIENGRIDAKKLSTTMFATDENQIKIQLIALGLLDVKAEGAKDGGVEEFASLTPQGYRRLIELLAVRGTTQGSPGDQDGDRGP